MVFLTTLALSVDYACIPGVTNVKVILSSALLLALLFQRVSTTRTPARYAPAVCLWRVLLFASFHVAGIAVLLGAGRANIIVSRGMPISAPVAAAKYLALLPGIILLPWNGWSRLQRLYRAELIAAFVALATLPSRIWAISWPWYSSALAHTIFALATPFVSGLRYIPGSFPILSGPTLDTTITLECGGMLIVELFQALFAIVLIVDWNKLNYRRTLVWYLAGIGFLLFANILRITLLVVAGNRISADLVVSQHLPASWLIIAIALVAYLAVVYPRMLNEQATGEAVDAVYCG